MAINSENRFRSGLSRTRARPKRQASSTSTLRGLEVLESRELLSTFEVTNLHHSGAGSLRQAIVESNAQPGANTIVFDVAGTIRVGRTPLPAITDTVTIDGSTAPSFAGSPVVTVDFRGTRGLNFASGSDGSVLRSLSLVRAGNAGVTISASHVTVQGNDIGLLSNGRIVAGNRGDGVKIKASSQGDLIGNSDAVSSISYYDADSVGMPVSGWEGIRASDTAGQYLITGTSGTNGLLYEGPISGSGGTSYAVDYPGADSTSVYGPDLLANGDIRLVGTYNNGVVNGFVFQGTTADLSDASEYKTIDYPGAEYTYVHSTMGDLAVGNADGPEGDAPIASGHAFLYDLATDTFLPNVDYPGSLTTTAYGIWYNGGTSYTICGGYINGAGPGSTEVSNAYLVDYNTATGQYSNWASFSYPNGAVGQDFITHFQGISSTEAGVYTLSADSGQSGSADPLQGSWVTVRLNTDGSFGPAVWVNLNDPGVDPSTSLTSNDSVYGNQVVGFVVSSSGMFSIQATVNTGFQLSNVISGNGGNGIGIYGADNNQIAMNDIGTDASGTLRRGNAKSGILVTDGAARNLIGGQATGGNDPTGNVFVRPPQGNLISGNRADGVFIKKRATQTLLSGNFVGTSASGNSALGNRQNGVDIVKSNGNQLIGCTSQQDPFVFYNVLSGNGGNGLRINNSNNTTVQANFMGAGADNATIVANGRNGLLVSGTSANTQVGGVIPLGNVISGNDRNGIDVSGEASGLTSFNTFTGIFAFGGAAPNRGDGTLITSSGGNNLIRTCIISGNLGNGIELGGAATGVQVTDTSIGTNTSIQTAIPNGGDGIKIDGHAHDNVIGGFQPSIEPQVTVSANQGYGIEIVGSAHDNAVYHTYIGTNAGASANLGNELGGIDLGPGTSSNTIGSTSPLLQDKILYSGGPGVTIRSSRGDTVLGNEIQYSASPTIAAIATRRTPISSATAGAGQDGVYITGVVTGTQVQSNEISSNTGTGVMLVKARRLTIGGNSSAAGNGIVGNLGYGLAAYGGCSGSIVRKNTIAANAQGNVNLTRSRGITYIP
ncbi:MAG: beta strand repeat-containing protein [Isosphaeraceae bacterium]